MLHRRDPDDGRRTTNSAMSRRHPSVRRQLPRDGAGAARRPCAGSPCSVEQRSSLVGVRAGHPGRGIRPAPPDHSRHGNVASLRRLRTHRDESGPGPRTRAATGPDGVGDAPVWRAPTAAVGLAA